ncbi:MAG: YcxB family protein [Butyricicoccus sp.]|nr:YcxB family protein [Butyricicoccus pullicaecorum]
MMELQYEIQEQDFIDYNMYFIDHDPLIQKTMRKLSIMMAGLVLVGGMALMYVFDALSVLSVVVYLVLAGACFLIGPAWFKRSARKNVRRTIQRAVNKHICGAKTLRLLEDGVQLVGESEDTLHPYEAFQRVVAAQNQVYLYLDDLSALIVPNTAFLGDDQKREFIAKLEAEMAEAKARMPQTQED